MNNDIPYTEKTLKLNTNAGFIEQFFYEYGTAKTLPEAYDRTEQLHHKYFGRRRFSSYDSFRQHLKRNRH